MRRRRRWQLFYKACSYGAVVLGLVVTCLGASLEVDPSQVAFGQTVVRQLRASAGTGLPVAAILMGLAEVGRRAVGEPYRWRGVHQALDELRDHVFGGHDDDPLHYHRVTLFKYHQWRPCLRKWPWSGWLVPVERSGHTTQSVSVRFKAPDEADQAEGVAGATWSRMSTVRVSGLPELGDHPTRDQVHEYADETFVSRDWVEDHLPTCRSLCGIPVEVNGKPWGVIVLDSRSPKPIKKEYDPEFRMVAGFLSSLLEGV